MVVSGCKLYLVDVASLPTRRWLKQTAARLCVQCMKVYPSLPCRSRFSAPDGRDTPGGGGVSTAMRPLEDGASETGLKPRLDGPIGYLHLL